MPNARVPADGGAMSAPIRIIRLRLALVLLRTARRMHEIAGNLIASVEREGK